MCHAVQPRTVLTVGNGMLWYGMVWCGVVWCGGAQCVFAVIIAAAAAVAPKTTTTNGKELNKRIGDEANRANKFL